MTVCAAINCKNTGTHLFPRDVNRRKLWEKALRRKNWKSSDFSRLCSDHFKPEDFYEKNSYTGSANLHKVLKKTAIPSIFSFTIVKSSNLIAQQRSERLINRNSRKELRFETPAIPDPVIGDQDGILVTEAQLPLEKEIILPSTSSAHLSSDLPVDVSHRSRREKSSQVNFEHIYGCIEKYKDNDAFIAFYTGFESYSKFYFVYSTLSPMAHLMKYYKSRVEHISPENQFFMTMMKLRQNKCNFELAQFFGTSVTTVSNIFITWINFIYQLWIKLNIWPSKDLVEYYMPDSFKKAFKTTRVIIDGTEMKMEKPGNPISQQASWSSYKHNNTLKVLVGATPGGLLSYCSPAYAGSVSDRQTVERSNLLHKLEPGDSILADRGYNIQDMFIGKDVTLITPTFLKGKSQIPGLKVLDDRKLASQRVHIERLIGLTKTYKILKEELNHTYVPLASKIFFVCLMCCNFRKSIM